jgi:exosortase A
MLGQLPEAWGSAVVALAAVAGLHLLTFFVDWADMVDQWWNSSTYNHIVLVPFIVGWLVWQRKDQLLDLTPRWWWPGLLLLTGAMLVWILGAFSDIATGRHLGTVLTLVAAIVTVVGPRVSGALFFPLAYCLFLVPIGDEFVPLLQTITAKITITLVGWSGIPAVIEGVFIDTPAGLFEVAEACSGVKFLVAMIAFGVLVSNVCFVSWKRRIAFMAACVIVPILANGVRAWGTIYAAQIFGIEAAAGFDHIVYGWFFFAIVLAMLLGGAWRFFDRKIDDPAVDVERLGALPLVRWLERFGGKAMPVALAGLGIIVAGHVWAAAAERIAAPVPDAIALPAVEGWQRAPFKPRVWWEPRAIGSNHRLLGSYADTEGRKVDVFVAMYAAQHEGAEAAGFGQGALVPDSAWSWLANGPANGVARSERLLAEGHVERLAYTWYRTDGMLTGSAMRLQLAVMGQRLLLQPEPTTVLILSAANTPDHTATDSLAAFQRSIGAVDKWIDGIASVE